MGEFIEGLLHNTGHLHHMGFGLLAAFGIALVLGVLKLMMKSDHVDMGDEKVNPGCLQGLSQWLALFAGLAFLIFLVVALWHYPVILITFVAVLGTLVFLLFRKKK